MNVDVRIVEVRGIQDRTGSKSTSGTMTIRSRIRRATVTAVVCMAAGLVWLVGYAPGDHGFSGSNGIWSILFGDAAKGMALIGRQVAQPLNGTWAIPLGATAVLSAALIVGPARHRLVARVSRRCARLYPSTDLAVFGPALFAAIASPIMFVLAGIVAGFGIGVSIRLLPETVLLAVSSLLALTIAGLGFGIGHALRSPTDKSRRPVTLPPGLSRTIAFYPSAAGTMLGLAALIDVTSRLLDADPASWFVAQGIVVIAETALIARFLLSIGEVRSRLTAGEGGGRVPAIFGVSIVAWVALGVATGAFVFGHVRFAMTVLQEMLWVGLILTLAWLITRFMDAVVSRFLDAERHAARFATNVVGVEQARVGQTALLLSAIFSILVWAIAAFLMLAPLYGDGVNVVQQVRPSPLREAFASINLSPRTIGTALGVLIGGVLLTRMARSWLEQRFLPTTQLDIGVRTSLVTGVGYVGVIAALLATTGALGVQLERITLIASALSVGIGFGLQAIIQNFVSGVILLAERPVKIGDRVTVGGSEGRVSRIRVRATELISSDGEVAIVPNSSFISSTVVNKGTAVADEPLLLMIKVAGPASALAAHDLLMHRLDAMDAIRHDPAPKLQLTAIADGDWTFRLKGSAGDGLSIREATSRILYGLDAVDRETARFTVS